MTGASVSSALRSVQCTRRRLAIASRPVAAFLLTFTTLSVCAKPVSAAEAGVSHGTAVVVLRTPHALFAAVDSKEVDQVYTDGKLRTSETVACKMKKVGPWYSIVAGVMRGTNGFDAQQEIAADYKPGDSLEALAQSLQQSVPRMLVPMLTALLEQNPADFARDYLTKPALHLTLIGAEQKATKVLTVEFQAVQTAPGQLALTSKTLSCPGNCPGPNVGYFFGAHEAVEAAVQQNPAALTKPSEQEIERLIGLEYVSRPDIVGGPVSLLKVDRAGATVARNGACELN